MENIDVSIIIVDYNAGKLIETCVHSIEENVKCPHEIIISDNGSEEKEINLLKDIEAKYHNVRVMYNGANCSLCFMYWYVFYNLGSAYVPYSHIFEIL